VANRLQSGLGGEFRKSCLAMPPVIKVRNINLSGLKKLERPSTHPAQD